MSGPVTAGPAELPFELDRFQTEAIAAIDAGRSVLVAAPTGAGKTVVAEHAVARSLADGRKAFYTTPIKALSNQKFGDLVNRHGADRVGLLTGDSSVNGDAPVVVMTTEVLRNMVYAGSNALDGLDFVVLDEVHYLQDTYRGPVWEEVIIHLPRSVRLVCLSATVSNAAELAQWISTVRGPTDTVIETTRPVELVNHYLVRDKHNPGLTLLPTLVEGRPNPAGDRFDSDTLGLPRHLQYRHRSRRRFSTPRRLEVVERLAEDELLPAIYFIFSRNGCAEAARSLDEAGVRLTTAEERPRIRELVEDRTTRLTDADLDLLDYDRWLAGLEQGVAAHHAGMVPPFKEAVEACFQEGLVKVVFATETLALGINMPARSVVIENLSKFTGERHQHLTPAEYTQLTGRAGRRGIDPVGHAVVLWSPFVGFDQVGALAASREFSLTSAFRPTYNMAANLVRRYDEAEAHRLLNQSFAQFQADRSVVALEARRAARRERMAEVAADAHCHRGDLEEYRRLLRTADEERRGIDQPRPARVGDGERSAVHQALEKLKPGDVVKVDGERLAVLTVAFRRGGSIKVSAVDQAGRAVLLAETDLRQAPGRLASLSLPAPFQPNDKDYRRDVSALLAKARLSKGSDGDTARRRQDRPRPPSSPAAEAAAAHPVARCPDRDAHLRATEARHRLDREVGDLDRRILARTGTIGRKFDQVLALLRAWGHLDGWRLTDRGRLLSRTYHESDLLVTEAMTRGLLDDLDPAELAGVVSCLTYEHRSKERPPPPWFSSATARARCEALVALAADLNRDERAAGLPETRPPDPTFFALAHHWAAGSDLDDLLADEELSGGDFVRNVKQLIDLLRQLADHAPSPATAAAAADAARAMFSGVVAASSVSGAP